MVLYASEWCVGVVCLQRASQADVACATKSVVIDTTCIRWVLSVAV